ncbi:MAG: hypothetical protein JSR61_08780 [Proteobacteria bacterium]|nr:hypothetical protein [Pseudomonadota bacterium]
MLPRAPGYRNQPKISGDFARFVSARVIKLVGNALKAAFYVFHLFMPSKRFLIPARAKPLMRAGRPSRIPRTVWQTNYTGLVTLPVYLNYLFNRLLCPGYEFRFLDDASIDRFVASEFPGRISERYARLQVGAARADLWRVLVLQRHGGVYLDIDSHMVWPLSAVVPDDADDMFLQHKDGLGNYFIASAPNSPNLESVIDTIMERIEKAETNNIFDLTGPGALDHALRGRSVRQTSYRLTCYQGTFTNEFFQYADSTVGKWTKAQQRMAVVSQAGGLAIDAGTSTASAATASRGRRSAAASFRLPPLETALAIAASTMIWIFLASFVERVLVVAPASALATEAAEIPLINLQSTCSRHRVVGGDRGARPAAPCLEQEKSAEMQLSKSWQRFPEKSRVLCVDRLDEDDPSYVALLTCLDVHAGDHQRS